MRRKIAILILCSAPMLALAGLFGIHYNSATTNDVPTVGVTGLPYAAQPASATLTNIDALLTAKQPASAGLTNVSKGNLTGMTNAVGPIVAATTGITVTPTTNAATGQITYTLSVP